MQAIILAAGFGSRLRPYTSLRPKPLFPVLNQPLVHRCLAQLSACNCSPILVNCHHLSGQMRAALAAWPEVLIQEEEEILGAGGSMRRALDRLDNDPILVVNADLYHDIDLEQLYHAHLRSADTLTLALHDYPRFNQVGIQDGRVSGFAAHSGERLAFTGIQVIDPELIERIPKSGFYHSIDLYQQQAEQGLVGHYRVDGARWRDIGSVQDYLGLHGELLHAQGWLTHPSCQLGPGVRLHGWGCIGAEAIIGQDAQLCDCVVWDGARVAPGAQFKQAIITGDARIDALAQQSGADRP